MKKSMLLLVVSLLVAVSANAAIVVKAPAQVGVTYYLTTGFGTYVTNPIVANTDGSLRIDVSSIPAGVYNITAQPCTPWGDCATPSTLNFSRILPNALPLSLVKE
jgi:hypothetical protein